MRKILATAVAISAMVLVSATASLAGEVKGPPGSGNIKGVNPNASLCAYSGLNDNIEGQTERQTQTPKDAAPGSAAHGWQVEEGIYISCNKNFVAPTSP
ncbi:MAG TPA: hypothetical protein VFI04_02005 [Gaiellaceae bacterium]|jgi:hypothetical protein|nr:hypothetical protein [Gaiellaceae bacterium]